MWCSCSHDEEFPEEGWNLYQHIERVEGLNTVGSAGAEVQSIFKPYPRRLEPEPSVCSDADGELILKIWFRAPVNIRRICVASCGNNPAGHPASVHCFTGPAAQELGFESIEEVSAAQTIELPANPQADSSVPCALKPFSQVSFLLLHFRGRQGGAEQLRVSYVGLQGEHSHASRQPVDTKYETVHSRSDVQATDELEAGTESHDCM